MMHPNTKKDLERLKGFTVTSISEDGGDEFTESMPCLVLCRKDGKRIHAFISSDEEGNGPGHLMIEEAK